MRKLTIAEYSEEVANLNTQGKELLKFAVLAIHGVTGGHIEIFTDTNNKKAQFRINFHGLTILFRVEIQLTLDCAVGYIATYVLPRAIQLEVDSQAIDLDVRFKFTSEGVIIACDETISKECFPSTLLINTFDSLVTKRITINP